VYLQFKLPKYAPRVPKHTSWTKKTPQEARERHLVIISLTFGHFFAIYHVFFSGGDTTTTTNEASEIFLDGAVHHECRIVSWRTFRKAGMMFTLSLIGTFNRMRHGPPLPLRAPTLDGGQNQSFECMPSISLSFGHRFLS